MSSILIKGMKMPKACYDCPMYEADIYYCLAAERDIGIPSSDEGICSFCPLIELSDHGDLIDRDALNATDSWEWIRHGAPVVIPAERSEEGFDGDTWHDLNGATAAPSGMKWQSNGKSRFSGGYMHRLVKKDTGDVVPVVRCKDCEFYTEEDRWCRRLGLCGAFDTNGYCSHAERSEECLNGLG